ncbi:MAG TPA: hypothetical protein QGG59_00585 [Planctomycetota bacterium]|jgi:GGDEF domain-containing protein|nr:hypothetical protein [Planctomycetota bacterium]MDP7245562.1 hypothetical protein [Planctomycetota bacterium]MDP7561156.1 hypothetical protein [Planctomycetota bacterium]HJM38588.1 hypothetical protein [Planctomycetota bacterium]|tara:strand:+ start:14548 stop:15444 length:897 start_codon:yes stop_codon:yes gene_type:complete
MPAPTRPLTLLSADPEIIAATQAAVDSAGDTVGDLTVLSSRDEIPGASMDGLVVVDPAFLAPQPVHEWVLALVREARALVWVLTTGDLADADGLARFVGAQGAISSPPNPEELAERLSSPFGTPAPIRPAPQEPDDTALSLNLDAILEEASREPDLSFIQMITRPDTGLYTAEYWQHRLDEEFKRSMRFRFPLGVVSFTSEGEIDSTDMLDIAGVILLDTRDVDIVAQFDPRSFVALLPHTGPAGTKLFAERVQESLQDKLANAGQWSVRVACCPDSSIPSSSALVVEVLGLSGGAPA